MNNCKHFIEKYSATIEKAVEEECNRRYIVDHYKNLAKYYKILSEFYCK